ncbi:MAG: spore coat protein U domain-containing protein [Clostridia bacterium]|nr:spore coat protein U domain-containing protein [Deltaproteobacteria bacterium]
MKRLDLTLLFALALGWSDRAQALGACSVSTITTMDFGAYDVFSSSPRDTTATLTIGCVALTGSQSILMTLSKGSSNTYAMRLMKLGAYALQYNVFLDAQRTVIFGDGTGGSSPSGPYAPSVLLLGSFTTTLYGRIYASQNVTAGVFNDNLTVTVNF